MNASGRGLSLLQALALVSGLAAQSQFVAPPSAPTSGELGSVLAFVDLDGDGDLDLWASAGLLLREDRPDGTRFVAAARGSVPSSLGPLTVGKFGDVDGDGDLDAVLGHLYGSNHLLINDGRAHFVAATQPLPTSPGAAADVALFDADGDGDLDYFVATANGLVGAQDGFFRNDGAGRFSDESATALPPVGDNSGSVACGDLDADGDVDLVVAVGPTVAFGNGTVTFGNGIDKVLLNDGAGRFVTASGLRALPSPHSGPGEVELVDVDGDADLDVVRSRVVDSPVRQVFLEVSLNDGAGRFSAGATSQPVAIAGCGGMATGDLDGDSDIDILAGVVWQNDGAGRFTAVTAASEVGGGVLADIDGDGDLDLATCGLLPNDRAFYANVGAGRFEPRSLSRLPPREVSVDVQVGDLNNDGIRDHRWRADRLANRRPYLPFAALDLSGDGVPECIGFSPVGRSVLSPEPVTIWEDDGTGDYLSRVAGVSTPAVGLTQPVSRRAIVATGDLDGDGDEDFVLATQDFARPGVSLPCTSVHEVVVYHSDVGGLRRTDLRLPNLDVSVAALDLADVDDDGDLDLVLAVGHAGCAAPDRLLINDGVGNFVDESAQRLPVGSSRTTQVAFADVDGDGDVDMVRTGELLPPAGNGSTVWLNDGRGRFIDGGPGRLPVSLTGALPIRAVDLDADGDVDLACEVLALNDGSGIFSDATLQLTGTARLSGARAVDVDLDGDVDIFGLSELAFVNQRRQWFALDLPRIGQDFTLRAVAVPAAALVVPLIGFGRREVDTPFGPLGVEPVGGTPLAPLRLPGADEVTVRVPLDPGIIGLRLWSQALFMHEDGSREIRLSNVVTAAVVDLWLR